MELVSITTPEQSDAEHERMTDAAQEILKKLDLAHRVVTLCTGDMGFSAQKTYDIEVGCRARIAYREISPAPFAAFQARRMNTRYRTKEGRISKKIDTILVSGTNGKSLTLHFAAKLLKEEGFKVGLSYSNHILTYNKRISTDAQLIKIKILQI